MPARLALVRLMIVEELWRLFLVVFDRGIAFVSVFVIAGAMRAALHFLSRVTERIL
jgi:hypothetical protein